MNQQTQKKEKAPEDLRTKSSGGINLIPPMSKEEKKKVNRKENVNLTSAVLIFIVAFFTLGLLIYYGMLKAQIANYERSITQMEKNLDALKEEELLIKHVVAKYDALRELRKEDLQYFYLTREVEQFPQTVKVKSISLDEVDGFEFSGLATNDAEFDNFVASLEENSSFNEVTISQMNFLNTEQLKKAADQKEAGFKISWKVSGYFRQELNQSDVVEGLQELNSDQTQTP